MDLTLISSNLLLYLYSLRKQFVLFFFCSSSFFFFLTKVSHFLYSEGSQFTPAHKTPSFKFKDYFPIVFRHLREKFKIDPTEYMVSICHTLDNGQNALLELPTPGKSGSLFFFSQDMKYILKTIPKREAKLLRSLLPAYYQVK